MPRLLVVSSGHHGPPGLPGTVHNVNRPPLPLLFHARATSDFRSEQCCERRAAQILGLFGKFLSAANSRCLPWGRCQVSSHKETAQQHRPRPLLLFHDVFTNCSFRARDCS